MSICLNQLNYAQIDKFCIIHLFMLRDFSSNIDPVKLFSSYYVFFFVLKKIGDNIVKVSIVQLE